MTLTVLEYLRRATDQTIPPMVLEIVLRSGRSFYVRNVFALDETTGLVPICVWDLRALDQADHETVLRRLNAVATREELESVERLHPKLDHGNMWVLVSEIEAIMEWQDRLWPPIESTGRRQVQIGKP